MGNLQSLVQCSITSVILFIYLWILFETKWNNSPYRDRTELINGLKIYLQKQGTEHVWNLRYEQWIPDNVIGTGIFEEIWDTIWYVTCTKMEYELV